MVQVKSAYNAKLTAKQAKVASTPDMARQRAAILSELGLKSDDTVIEVGCGNGLLTNDIASKLGNRGEVIGTDPSPQMIESAQSFAPSITFQVADANSLPFGDNSADKIAAAQVYCFVPNLTAALTEAARILKPGGSLVILDTDWDSLIWSMPDEATFALAKRILLSDYAHDNVPHILPKLLTKVGFENITQSELVLEDATDTPNTYASSLNSFVEDALNTVSKYPPAQLADWRSARNSLIAAGRFQFKLNRIITSARKAFD